MTPTKITNSDQLCLPCEPLMAVSNATKNALKDAAYQTNRQYLTEFIEDYSFCPFSKIGRKRGQTSRYFYYADTVEIAPLIELMVAIGTDPAQAVAQVIIPLIEIDADDWREFCLELTALGNSIMGSPEVLAVAALHPELSFSDTNAFSVIPLFRRAPDPTIQWVRLDALDALYKGRESDKFVIPPDQIEMYLAQNPNPKPPLYDRIAQSNYRMARRLTFTRVEAMLKTIAADGRRRYQNILLDDRYDHDDEAE